MNDIGLPRIAICFFGITRSLTHTIGSIEANILAPARELGEVRIFAHFFRQTTIDNPRSGEKGALRRDEHELLSPHWLELEEPDHCLEEHRFEALKAFGDEWRDDFRSLRNLVHQIHSLERVTKAALDWEPDVYVFARPDLLYHDSFKRILKSSKKFVGDAAFLPNWQHFGGLNDRFSVCCGKSAAVAYGFRIKQAVKFCDESLSPLHAEKLLAFALARSGIDTFHMRVRASRVRFDGTVKIESFRSPFMNKILGLRRISWKNNSV